MHYHSVNYSAGEEEFMRVLILAASNTTQLLIVSPGPIGNLETAVTKAFSSAVWKFLHKNRKTAVPGTNLTIYLEARRTKSEFTKGNVYLPYASMHTVDEAVRDVRTVNTFFLPQSGPKTGWNQDDLSLYLKSYPSSISI